MQAHGELWHFGHLCLYFSMDTFSKSIPSILANEDSQANTSANSFSIVSRFDPLSSSPSSATSSTSQLNVPLTPRSKSRFRYRCFIIN